MARLAPHLVALFPVAAFWGSSERLFVLSCNSGEFQVNFHEKDLLTLFITKCWVSLQEEERGTDSEEHFHPGS